MRVRGQLEAARKIIEDLLTPKDDEHNDWKRTQLRELGGPALPPTPRSLLREPLRVLPRRF